jgi:peptidoglycan/LPS O-acetylase OafA/YrhL
MVPIIFAPVIRVLAFKQWYPEGAHFLFSFGSFFERCDSLAYGCLAAVLLAHWRPAVESFYRRYAVQLVVGGSLFILTPGWFHLLPLPPSLLAASVYSLKALGFTVLLLQSVLHPGWGFYRALNWACVRHFGVLSYSIYIWQQMFFVTDASVFGSKDAWWLRFPAWILVALLAAHASYYLMEKPLLRLRAKYRDS